MVNMINTTLTWLMLTCKFNVSY